MDDTLHQETMHTLLASMAELKAQNTAMGREIGELKADIKALEERQRKSEEAMASLTGKIVGWGSAAVVVLGLLEMAVLIWK